MLFLEMCHPVVWKKFRSICRVTYYVYMVVYRDDAGSEFLHTTLKTETVTSSINVGKFPKNYTKSRPRNR